MADTGWIAAGTGTNVAGAGADWVNPGNITADDATRASCAIPAFGESDLLRASNFGATIPAGAAIDGIEFRLQVYNNEPSGTGWLVSVVGPAGTSIGTAKTGTNLTTTVDAVLQLGGAADLWDTTPTETDVEDVDWGCVFRADDGAEGNAPTVQCDFIEMKIYYTGAASPNVAANFAGHPKPPIRELIARQTGVAI